MKKKLNLKKETVAMLDGMGEVRGGGGTVAASVNSNCFACPTMANTCNSDCTLCPTKRNDCAGPTDPYLTNPYGECGAGSTMAATPCQSHKQYEVSCFNPPLVPVE